MRYKGIIYNKITRKNNNEYFKCIKCNKRFIAKEYYRSKNLCYLCLDCIKKINGGK
jgi:hypothetical protein